MINPWIVVIIILSVGALQSFLPLRVRLEIFFGVTPGADFRETAATRAIWRA